MTRWHISPRFFLRTSGMPFEDIELDRAAAAALDAALTAHRAAEDATHDAARACHRALDAAPL
ncbi:MAG: hypothetical protein H6703_11065, partial [Myxococcales bacterium]|nr:hypothetical protein [Myxococcales bacterium]